MAERVPFFTLFESFQAPRQLRLLLHDACIISGALDMAGRTLEVQVESSETLPQAAQDALQQMLAQQYDLRQVLLHFCGTGEQKGDNGVIWGKTITGKLTPIGELNIKQGSAIVEGRVFKAECYETRRKGMWTLNFNITDERGNPFPVVLRQGETRATLQVTTARAGYNKRYEYAIQPGSDYQRGATRGVSVLYKGVTVGQFSQEMLQTYLGETAERGL